MVVHLPHQAPAELDGTQAAAEGTGEHTIDHTLQAMFEGLQAHKRDRR
jgi:hypothetical protein